MANICGSYETVKTGSFLFLNYPGLQFQLDHYTSNYGVGVQSIECRVSGVMLYWCRSFCVLQLLPQLDLLQVFWHYN